MFIALSSKCLSASARLPHALSQNEVPEENMKKLRTLALFLAVPMFGMLALPALGQGPQAVSPYQLTAFAKAPAGLSAPDSVVVFDNHVFVGYGDGHLPDGTDGLSSQVVEFAMDGSVVHIYTVPGHNDGLKVDPFTNRLWALQNEDANANLVIINPQTQKQKLYTFGPTLHGGGYDDIVFRGCNVYISASNPANTTMNSGPAIVSARLEGKSVEIEPVLAGDASAIDIPTDATVQLNLTDPDSMTLDPLGNIVLDSQGDQELIIVSNPGSNQRVLRLPLSYLTPSGPMSVETDDTAFITSTQGFLIFADKGLNTVYILKRNAFSPGTAFTAADGGPFVGTLDFTTGVITPIVTGLSNPGGMVFVDTSQQNEKPDGGESQGLCQDLDGDSQ
jgi:hypothetical protein